MNETNQVSDSQKWKSYKRNQCIRTHKEYGEFSLVPYALVLEDVDQTL